MGSLTAQPDPHGICMSLEFFTICQCSDSGAQSFQSLSADFLEGDVFLERLRVHTTELPSVSVRGERVVGSRCIVPTAATRSSSRTVTHLGSRTSLGCKVQGKRFLRS